MGPNSKVFTFNNGGTASEESKRPDIEEETKVKY
jgi:hypothetical protein